VVNVITSTVSISPMDLKNKHISSPLVFSETNGLKDRILSFLSNLCLTLQMQLCVYIS
jgi:hypothetical protein